MSEGTYRSLNLGILTDDDPARVAGNRERLAHALHRDPVAVAMGWQVHGGDVQCHAAPPQPSAWTERGAVLARVDAQVTDHPEVTALVLTADCLPLALGAPGAVAMVHCGWRGLSAGIVERAVAACCEAARAEPDVLGAAIGPGVGRCCYEVGAPVRSAFADRGHGSDVLDGGRLDLGLAVRHELEWAGVASDRIVAAGLCTSCLPDLFFSHRRDGGLTGRQAGVAWREP